MATIQLLKIPQKEEMGDLRMSSETEKGRLNLKAVMCYIGLRNDVENRTQKKSTDSTSTLLLSRK